MRCLPSLCLGIQVTPDNIHSLLAGSSLLQATAVFNACTEVTSMLLFPLPAKARQDSKQLPSTATLTIPFCPPPAPTKQYLRSHVTVSNCLEVLDLAATYGTEELKAEAVRL